ncbi:MAG: phosphatidylinositol mannoside acyltransferase [Micrococcales bacterium]|nr:phosphatidylinositol mannoside acyltransferase [Micrococcales bacterium]
MDRTAFAWKVVPRLPKWLATVVFNLVAEVAWLRRNHEVRRLESNLSKVLPDTSARQLRQVSRLGMRRHLRYYREALAMGSITPKAINQLVKLENQAEVVAQIGPAKQAILVLAHLGNWDAAGAWASLNIAPVITVAEQLEPQSVFDDFVKMRTHIGMTIIPLKKGESVYGQLVEATRTSDPFLVCLLADRDLSKRGIEVDWFGHRALVGAGPAALAVDTGLPLYPVSMRATTKGYVLEFHSQVIPPPGLSRVDQIQDMTQQWAARLEKQIRQNPADWHMFQKVFVQDLDPERLKAVRGE